MRIHGPSFSSRMAFVLCAAGSAVGLGNLWRFPYLAAKYGGGIFLLTYLVLVVLFGYPMLLAENAIGRHTRQNAVGSFRTLCPGRAPHLRLLRLGGWINAVVPLLILPYYTLIGGWVTSYLWAALTLPVEIFAPDHLAENGTPYADAYFVDFISSVWPPLIFLGIFLAACTIVIACGVKRGLEKFNLFIMPVLVLLSIGLAIHSCLIPGAAAGLKYYFQPDFSQFSFKTLAAATGQLFFSLSIAMGIMYTYGSYMRRDDDLPRNINQVELFDTGIAFLAGLIIIPAVVAFSGDTAALNAGPGLLFITMPKIFAGLPGGRFIGILFFLLVLMAAVTSSISMIETNVQYFVQELKLKRSAAIALAAVEALVIGVVTALGYNVLSGIHPIAGMDILDSLDFLSNSLLMPIGAIFTALLVTAVIGVRRFRAYAAGPNGWRREPLFRFSIRFIVIPCLLIVLVTSLMQAFGLLKI